MPSYKDNRGNNNKKQKPTQERRKMVWELTLEGFNYFEIAERVKERYRRSKFKDIDNVPNGYDHAYVAKDIKRSLEQTKSEVIGMARKHREIQVQRIERMIQSVWSKIKEDHFSGDKIDAINTINRLQKRKADLLGLDDPEQIEMINQEIDEDSSFEWPDPDDAPQLTHRKEENNGEEVHKNGQKQNTNGQAEE